jgi:hypothetical protein
VFIEEKKYGVSEVFNMIGEECLMQTDDANKHSNEIIVDGFHVYSKSLRYMTFYQKGTKCVCCGKEGTHFKLCGDPNTNRRHFNLYADDGTLMTKDHIVPASKGGQDKVSNMQTMCAGCNSAKGNESDVKKEYVVGRKNDKEIVFSTIEKAVYALVYTYGKQVKKKTVREDAVRVAITTTIKLLNALEDGTAYCGYIWTKEMR